MLAYLTGLESSSFRTLLGDGGSKSAAIAARLRFCVGGPGDDEQIIVSSPEEMEGAPGGPVRICSNLVTIVSCRFPS